jgi:hypothetical protein
MPAIAGRSSGEKAGGMSDWSIDSTTACKGVRLKYQGNVLYSASQRTTKANAERCYVSMALLLGVTVADFMRMMPMLIANEGMAVEAYMSS